MTSRAMLAALLLALTQVAPSDTVSAQGAAPAPSLKRSNAKAGCSRCNIARSATRAPTCIPPRRSGRSCRATARGGRDDVLRQVIADGTPNMPGFKHQFEPTQIDAIVAYLKTVPPQAAKPEKH